jgi:23S rRNA pseudouridine1911/1915/1917 synthase
MPPILYEDNDIMVVDKPSGLMVHGDGKTSEETLADILLREYSEMKEVGEPMEIEVRNEKIKIFRPGIVHRLDKETSGALIICKNQKSFEFIKKQFQNHEIKKVYHALVWGNIKEDSGHIDADIGRSKNDFRKWLAGRGTRGVERTAITDFKVLKRIDDESGEKYTYVEVMPKTGRTHQIRVHMKYIQHPLVGDSLYAEARPYALGFTRLALHAYSIEFTDLKGEIHKIEAPLPSEFTSL